MAEGLKNLDKEKKKRLVKAAAMAAVGLILVIAVTIAWFMINKEVSAGSLAMQAADIPFELASKTAAGNDDEVFEKLDGGTEYVVGESYTFKDDGLKGTKTGSGKDSVRMLVTDQSHLENRPASVKGTDEDDDTGIKPGSYGTLTFYVLAKSDFTKLDMTFTLDVTGIKEILTYEGEGDSRVLKSRELFKISDMEQRADQSDDQKQEYHRAGELLCGHILFFDSISGEGKYSDRITDREIKRSFSNVKKGDELPVTFYWVWPNTFGQMLYEDGSIRIRGKSLFEGEDDESRTELLTHLGSEEHSKEFFYDDERIKSYLADKESMDRYFADLSSEYNNADQCIGENVDHIMLEITAVIDS